MKILFTRFPLESAHGGAEVQTMLLAEGLRDLGHDVQFLGSCPVLLGEFRKRNYITQELIIGPPPVTKWGAISFLWRQFSMKRKLISALTTSHLPLPTSPDSKTQPTVLLMLSLTEKLLLTDWASERGIRPIWIEHDRIGRWLRWNPWLPMLRSASRKAKIVTVSALSRDLYLSLGFPPEHVIAIPNGIALERFQNVRNKGREPDFPRLHIGCIARLTRDKGVDLLIEAVAGLPAMRLSIIGTGPQERVIASLIAEHGLADRVSLQPNIQVEDFYPTIDVLVLPSRDHDPFGLVVAEAMAAGVPVICTDACGIASHLSPDEAIVVPKDDTSTLRSALRTLESSDRWKTYRERGEVASRRFADKAMYSTYDRLLSA